MKNTALDLTLQQAMGHLDWKVVSLSGGGRDNSKREKRKENEPLEETGANGNTD